MASYRLSYSLVLSIVVTIVGYPARADWQFTRWGMNEQEVRAATGGTATKPKIVDVITRKGVHHLLSSPYATEEFNFEARYMFDAKGLSGVRLDLKQASEGKCMRLQYVLKNAYGASVDDRDGDVLHTTDWRDTANQNSIYYRYFKLTPTCSVDYERLPEAGESGGL
ncbi:MAG: hypothetical protein E5Y89_05065 [Mesorhizobium sp.]|nr:MAG: hypothetical protein E5Y89_05065 [Mesorhizobium sp.]